MSTTQNHYADCTIKNVYIVKKFVNKCTPKRVISINLFCSCVIGIDVVVMPATPRDSPLSNAKPEVVKKPEDLELKIGDVAEFEMVLKDRGDNIVSWKKDGNLLFSSGRIKIWDKGKKFFLQVKNLIESDEGLYECHIRNEFGETMFDVALTIDCKLIFYIFNSITSAYLYTCIFACIFFCAMK